MTLANKVAQFNADADLVHQVVHGSAATSVVTEGGTVRSLAKMVADRETEILAQAPALSDIANAVNQALGSALVGYNGLTVRKKLMESRSVEEFGAVGDNVANDVEAFVKAMRYSQDVGGCEITYGSNGRVYRIAYNSSFPAIVIPSGTMFRRHGGGYLRIDPTLIPASAPAGGSANWVPAYGEITTGDAYTLMRPGAGYAGGGPLDGFIVDNFDPDVAVHDVHLVNPKLVSTWVGTLASAQRCYGIRMWFCYDSTIHNPHITGMPHSGLMWSGGSRNATTGVAVITECGKGALPGVSRNGYNALGIMCLNEPTYSTRSHACGDVIVDENEDEGFMFANCGHIVVKSVVGRGNRDRLVEGDTSFDTAQTAALLGQEIPNDIIIGQIICDGANSDGGVGKQGVTVACGNEGRVSIGMIRVRNTATPADAVAVPISVSFAAAGRVSIGDVVLENCNIPASNHAVYVKAERVDVRDLKAINCTGTTNSAIVAIADADIAYVRNVDADTGFIHGVRFDGTRAARKLSVRGVSSRGLARSFVYLNLAARAELVEVIENSAEGINSAATSDLGFITVANASFRCGTLIVEDNRCRVASVITQPLTIAGGVTLPANSIDRARFRRNDFDDEGMFCLSSTQNPRCFNNSGSWITDLVDVGNFMPSQRVKQATAVPTAGTWGKGDTVHMQFPDPGAAERYRCTTPGTFATVTGVTATTVAGQSTATLSDASLVVPGSWISIAGVTANSGAVTGYFRVVSKAGNVVRFGVVLDQSVAGAAVANLAPVFKALTLGA